MSESNSEEKPTESSQKPKKSGGSKKSQGKSGQAAASKRKKSQKSKKVAGTFYNITGELDISSTSANIEDPGGGGLHSTDLVVDEKMNAFGKGSIHATFNDEKRMIVLDAEQVELLAKLLGFVENHE